MFGMQVDGTEIPAAMDLVRLAIPRRTYTQSHLDYVIEVCIAVLKKKDTLKGYKTINKPANLRHFSVKFEKIV
jgi:tryptophanase